MIMHCYAEKVLIVLLISGLPLRVQSSLSRQLRLLGNHLEALGMRCELSGPSPDPSRLSEAKACILLGYPDQFPFLTGDEALHMPLFLWAQFSKPPDPQTLERVAAVPLTEKTREFVRGACVSRVYAPIPHGVDTSVFHPLSDAERLMVREGLGVGEGFVVGTVGANSPRKRFDSLMESFALFFKRHGDAFLIIKMDRRVSRDGIDIEELAKKMGILKRLRVIEGDIPESDLCRLYGAMDVYMNLSEWEGFCVPVIEAMACGLPVAALPIQGPGEIVPYDDLIVSRYTTHMEGKTTLLWADPDEAARVLVKAAGDPHLRAELKQRGLREVRERYDIRHVARAWEMLIRGNVDTG